MKKIFGNKKINTLVLFAATVFLSGACQKYTVEISKHEAKSVFSETKGYVAIVIDDFGYNGEGTTSMLELDIPLTAAIMPFSAKSVENVQAVKDAGKEIIVHMPMESLTGKKSWVGDKGVFKDMSEADIEAIVNEAIDIADGAVGLNNHMGSAIMEDERSFLAVAKVMAERNLIFLDSMTTGKSVADKICKEKGISILKRDVFLDSTDDISVVKNKLKKAQEIALSKGYAIAIGHVGPEGGNITVSAIKEMKDEMQKNGIEFVTINQLNNIINSASLDEK